MAQTLVNFRLDTQIKNEMEFACKEMGLSMTAAFKIFATRVAKEKRIPFDVSAEVPNLATKKALKEVEEMKRDPNRGKSYTDVDEMMKELLA